MSFKEKVKIAIKEKLGKSSVSSIVVLGRGRGLDEDAVLNPETGEFGGGGVEEFFCSRCEKKTKGKDFCENCGCIRKI